jgi:two-component system, NarL family, response regulator NreC
MTAIRVLLVDDHAVVRVGLRALLGTAPDMDVVGEADDGAAAIAESARLRPDVVVMDLSMEGIDGVAATRRVVADAAAAGAATRVLVLTMHDEREYLITLLEAGARGYVVKSAAGRELIDAVRAVAAGRVYVQPAAAPVLAGGWARRAGGTDGGTDGAGAPAGGSDAAARVATLSQRERDVLALVARGYTLAQAGERLGISAKTVDTYKRRIADKAGLADRADYVRVALELGLLTPG